MFSNISLPFRFSVFSLKYLNMTKTYHLDYNIILEKFCVIIVSGIWKLSVLILVKMLYKIFLKMPTESFSVALDIVY